MSNEFLAVSRPTCRREVAFEGSGQSRLDTLCLSPKQANVRYFGWLTFLVSPSKLPGLTPRLLDLAFVNKKPENEEPLPRGTLLVFSIELMLFLHKPL